MPAHVMLDLETLGNAPGCVILSIGAVLFTETEISTRLSVHINAASSQRAGLSMNAETVLWWISQGEAARRALLAEDAVHIIVALRLFTALIAQAGASTVRLWSKGPSFDAAILAAAYRAVDLPVPWDFRNERCVRTICELAGVRPSDFADAARLRHDALSDALVQTRAVQEAMKRLHV